MTMIRLVVLVLVVLVYASVQGEADRVRRATCGSKPYDPQTHQCCSGQVNWMIWGRYKCCGYKNYNPSRKICCNGTPQYRTGGTSCCGTDNYDPVRQMCCSGRVYWKSRLRPKCP